jgi:hypothetical protein
LGDITQQRFQGALRRIFGIKTTDPARIMPPVVSPSADVLDPYQPENRCNRGERTWSLGTTFSNTAASFGIGQLFNPVGSGKLVVLKRAIVSWQAPTNAVQPGNPCFFISQFFAVSAGLVKTANILPQDARNQVTGTLGITAGWNFQTSGIAGPTQMFSVYLPCVAAAQPVQVYQFDQLGIVFTPGFGSFVGVVSDALATATYSYGVYLEGYERTADPAELIAPAI